MAFTYLITYDLRDLKSSSSMERLQVYCAFTHFEDFKPVYDKQFPTFSAVVARQLRFFKDLYY